MLPVCDWDWNLTKTKNKHVIRNSQKHCCICGYHVFNDDIWEEAVGELLVLNRELRNAANKYAMALNKDESNIGTDLGRCCVFAHYSTERKNHLEYSE